MTTTAPVSSATPSDGLRDARETERLGHYLRAVWARRHYMAYVARSELQARQINSILGNLWHLLNPILQISVFFVIFGLVLDVTRGVDNFVGYLAVGVFTYAFSQRSATSGGRSLQKYSGLMQMISFPRATLPLTTTITETLAIVPGYFVMLLVATGTGEQPSLSWLLVIPFGLIQAVFNMGLAMVVARAVDHIPDVQQVLPFIFRLGFYASGVLFNIRAYVEGSTYQTIIELNPLYCFIELNRGVLLGDHGFEPHLLLTALVWTAISLVGGFIWFRRAEDLYGNR